MPNCILGIKGFKDAGSLRAVIWKLPRCPSVGEWVKQMWCGQTSCDCTWQTLCLYKLKICGNPAWSIFSLYVSVSYFGNSHSISNFTLLLHLL